MTTPTQNHCICGCGTRILRGRSYARGHDARHRNAVMREHYGTVEAMATSYGIEYPRGRGADFAVWKAVLAHHGGSTVNFVRSHRAPVPT